jgi:aminoglycoside 6'-N-acetyltransferase
MARVIFRETERVRLRQFELRDSTRLAAYRSDPDVARYQSWEAMTSQEAEAFIAALPQRLLDPSGEWCQIAIADRITDELIGDIGLCRASAGNVAELGVTFAPAAQGAPAIEACRAAVELVLCFRRSSN